MSGIGGWLWGNTQIDDAVDKATSELLPAGAEDIALNLEICDQIRSKAAPAKYAMRALKRRLNHKNPNVQLLALGLTDICVKNGGDHFLVEVASREFMDNLVSILKIPTLHLDVKNCILRLIQNWSVAFEGKPSLSYAGQVYKTLTSEGYKFPPKDLTAASSAMVDTQTAPEWIDSEVCLRCRDDFSFTNRKHHCRNCGQVFDQKCSSKSAPLPHFGITQEVRVCDGCYSKLSRKVEKADKGHRHSTSLHGTRHRSARELADAELQRAIQLSLQEVHGANGYRPGYVPAQPSPSAWQYSEPPLVDRATQPTRAKSAPQDEEEDPDLRAAIEASLMEANAPKPSAPIVVETPRTEEAQFTYSGAGYSQSYPPGVVPPHPSVTLPNYDLEPLESDAILTFSQTVEQVQSQGGRDMSRYPAVNELYDKANSLRPKLAMSLDDAGRKEQMLTDMHDKMSQIVKLYDNLLSDHVAHPRWRSPPTVASPTAPYQVANSSYSTGYNTAYGYAHQAPVQQSTTPSGYQPSVEQPAPSQPYAPSSPPIQPQYTNTSQAEPAQAQWYSQQPQTTDPRQYNQMAQQASPPPPPGSSQYSVAGPSTPSQQQQYTPQQQYATQSQPSLSTPAYAAPPIQPSFSYQPHHSNSTPVSLPQSPPPAPYTPPNYLPQQQQSTSPALSRHNTVAHPSQPHNSNAFLSRSNTLGNPPAHHTPAQQRFPSHGQQQQIASPAPPPANLPQFPIAPTLAPQAYPMYGPSVPSGVAHQEERKEALLIDL